MLLYFGMVCAVFAIIAPSDYGVRIGETPEERERRERWEARRRKNATWCWRKSKRPEV